MSNRSLESKARDAPMVVVGVVGLLVVCGLGVVKYRQRGEMSRSQFLMQLRVAAQGTFVAALTAGAIYSMASGGSGGRRGVKSAVGEMDKKQEVKNKREE